jgi:chorismate lyase/3-hydroxybenzoate synthase
MAAEARTSNDIFDALAPLEPIPPRWVQDVLGPDAVDVDLGPHVRGTASRHLLLVVTTIEQATSMSADAVRARVTEAYRRLGAALASTDRSPVRFWNFIPDLGRAMGPDIDRYMVFNLGRYDAFRKAGHALTGSLATASAVGIGGTDLVIYCLASSTPGTPVENPRQKSSWLYSSRYGPRPPCFSRATIATIGSQSMLLIGGTASIVGEESRHPADPKAQLDETLENIASVVTAAKGAANEVVAPALERLVAVRAYVRHDDDAGLVRRELARRCPRAERMELVRARICRPELLLEIEAVAEM